MAELAARELRGLALNDALDRVALIAEAQPERMERAAVRWHGRLEVEAGRSAERSKLLERPSAPRPSPARSDVPVLHGG
jgi:hypothetical protein